MKPYGMHGEKARRPSQKYRGRYSGKYSGYGSAHPVASDFGMAVTDQSKVMPEDQASGLIDLVLAGEDPDEIMSNTIEQIHEGYGGGPYAIGTSVKVNKAWSGETVGGGQTSLSQGDIVSIVVPNLGEQGHDKMVLLSDGKTRVVVPLDVLGESIVESPSYHTSGGYGSAGDTVSPAKGPSGHAVPSTTGAVGGLINSKVVGQSKPTDLPNKKGQGKASSAPSKAIGQSAKTNSPEVTGNQAPSSHPSVAVEAVLDGLEDMIDGANDLDMQSRLETLRDQLSDFDDAGAFAEVYEMLYGDDEHSIEDLEGIFEDMTESDDLDNMSPMERKKYLSKYRKKYRGKYSDMPKDALKMLTKYGSNHAKQLAAKGSE